VKHKEFGLFSQSMGFASNETVEASVGIRGSREPLVCTIEIDENDEIIIWSTCSGFQWRPQFLS